MWATDAPKGAPDWLSDFQRAQALLGPLGRALWAVSPPRKGRAPWVRSPCRAPGVAPAPRSQGPRPRHKLGSPSDSRVGGGTGRTNFLLGCGQQAAGGGRQEASQAAPGPRCLCASPLRSFAPGGDRGTPRRATGGRLGDAELRRRDRRNNTSAPEVSGVRYGRWRCIPAVAVRPEWPEQAGDTALHEGRAALGCRVLVRSLPP